MHGYFMIFGVIVPAWARIANRQPVNNFAFRLQRGVRAGAGLDVGGGRTSRFRLCHGADDEGTKIGACHQSQPLRGEPTYIWGAGMHRINTVA